MKVYLSADIEGVCGINNWNEADYTKPEYAYFRNQMNKEVIAACEGALAAGATEIVVRDAHGASKNLDADRLPKQATLIRGWSGHPYSMVQGIDQSFAACLMVGYHARAGSVGNPLAHTMSLAYSELRLNGKPLSEYALHAMAAELEGVPTVFLSGDEAICEEVKGWQSNVVTVATTSHAGTMTRGLVHPSVHLDRIKEGVLSALKPEIRSRCHLKLPGDFVLDVDYKEQTKAYRASFFPGAERVSERSIRIRATSYFEILRTVQFIG